MNIKWNWGTKLFIAIVLFMSLISGFVVFSFKNEISLVEKDYYPKGQEYQQRLNEMKNASLKKDFFLFTQTKNGIMANTPVLKADTASMLFFRSSDKKLDRVFDIASGDTSFMFENDNFEHGKYIVKVYWKSDNIGYYFERPFFFE
jgi:hypothetical protein